MSSTSFYREKNVFLIWNIIIQGLKKTPLKRYGVTHMVLTGSQNEHYKYPGGRKTHLLDLYGQNHELDPYNFNVFPFEHFYKKYVTP